MLKNYFKTAFRSLQRNRIYAAINITGLAVGIAASLLIFMVIQFEMSFDKFKPNWNRIYRIGSDFKLPDGIHYSAGACFVAARQLRIDYPQLQNVSTIMASPGDQITVLDESNKPTQKKFDEQKLFFIEPHFFEMFDFPFIAGDPKTALAEPNTVVLTQATAERYFGNWQNAIGRTIQYKDQTVCKVTGILKNLPVNTDFPIEVALSLKTNSQESAVDWNSNNGFLNIFVLAPPGMTQTQLKADLLDFTKRHTSAENAAKRWYTPQPLSEIHTDSRYGNYNNRTFGKDLTVALSLIGLFLIVIACINFINLATAQAVNRAKEVGIRKVLGSLKKQLIWQFFSETFIITCLSVIIAVIIAFGTLPFLNQLLKTSIAMPFNSGTAIFLIGVLMVVTLLSGLYPAVILSGFNPVTALKSKFSTKMVGGISLRRVLVVLQFTVAQALIIGTLVVIGQTDYFKNAPMGFDKEAIVNVTVPNDSLSITKYFAFKTQLLQQPSVKSASFSTFAITDNNHWGSPFTYDNATKPVDFNADLKWSDADVFKTYGLQMVAGRPYEPSDTVREFVVNESVVKQLGLRHPEDILGKKMEFWGWMKGSVVGVVKDFNTASMKFAMAPAVMAPWKYVYGTIAIKLQPGNVQQTLSTIEKIWDRTYPAYVFKFQFLDDSIAAYYEQENQLSQLYKIFAGIAIFISCLGLYALVSFMAGQRTKEIGIRKVLGASASSIVYLFSKEFILLIVIAFAIAGPLAYYFMHNWLNDFPFRITIGAGIFVLTIAASISIAWLTVSYQAIKAAMMNPVEAIKTE
jgi:putative ABC transport system permease protein